METFGKIVKRWKTLTVCTFLDVSYKYSENTSLTIECLKTNTSFFELLEKDAKQNGPKFYSGNNCLCVFRKEKVS